MARKKGSKEARFKRCKAKVGRRLGKKAAWGVCTKSVGRPKK